MGESFYTLEKEIFIIHGLLFEGASQDVENRYYLPNTVFYIINPLYTDISVDSINEMLENSSSPISHFLLNYFCIKGVNPQKLPRSIIDNRFYVLRHPSYYFNQDLSEKFLLLPVYEDSNIIYWVRTIDLIASIEFYFTKFFYLIKVSYDLLSSIDSKTKSIVDSMNEMKLTSLKPKETNNVLIKLINLSQELFPQYPLCDKLQEELEHLYNDTTHLIDNILKPNIYSQASEQHVSNEIQGAIETIGNEFQMRINLILRNLPRITGRLYHTLTNITNLTRSYYEITSNKTMINYTRNIRALTIILILLTIVLIVPLLIEFIPFCVSFISKLFLTFKHKIELLT